MWTVFNVGMGIKKLKKRYDRETSEDDIDASISVSSITALLAEDVN